MCWGSGLVLPCGYCAASGLPHMTVGVCAGDKWVPRGETDPLTALTFDVHSVAVGTERMIVGGSYGIIQEAIPDPTGGVGRRLQGVLAVPRNPLWFPPIIDSICALPQAMQVCPNLLWNHIQPSKPLHSFRTMSCLSVGFHFSGIQGGMYALLESPTHAKAVNGRRARGRDMRIWEVMRVGGL